MHPGPGFFYQARILEFADSFLYLGDKRAARKKFLGNNSIVGGQRDCFALLAMT